MNVLIVVGHPVFREVLQEIFFDRFPSTAVECVANGDSAIRLIQSQGFTHLVLDLQLADIDGFVIADAAINLQPTIRIIVLTSCCNNYSVFRTERRCIKGFVDTQFATASAIRQAIESVAADGVYFSPSFLRLKAERRMDPRSFDKILSDREMSVLALVATPFSDREIANELSISPETVEKHRFNMLRKLNLRTTTELMRFARLHGIACSPEHLRKPTSTSLLPSSVANEGVFYAEAMRHVRTDNHTVQIRFERRKPASKVIVYSKNERMGEDRLRDLIANDHEAESRVQRAELVSRKSDNSKTNLQVGV